MTRIVIDTNLEIKGIQGNKDCYTEGIHQPDGQKVIME